MTGSFYHLIQMQKMCINCSLVPSTNWCRYRNSALMIDWFLLSSDTVYKYRQSALIVGWFPLSTDTDSETLHELFIGSFYQLMQIQKQCINQWLVPSINWYRYRASALIVDWFLLSTDTVYRYRKSALIVDWVPLPTDADAETVH